MKHAPTKPTMPAYRHLVRAHDGSSHGGIILPVAHRPLIAGQAQALVGDAVFCPRCAGTFAIIGWHPSHPLAKGHPAAAGMVTECGAILQATQKQQSMSVDFLAQAQQLILEFAAKDAQQSAFMDPQRPPNTSQDPFTKAVLIRQLRARLARSLDAPNITTPYIQQGPSSLCGPACFAYCLLQDRPDLYVATIMALWQYGHSRLGDLRLRPSQSARRPKRFSLPDEHGHHTPLPMVDWILLASLKDSSNKVLPYATPYSKTAGITFWFHLDTWFQAVGARKAQHYYAPLGSSQKQLARLRQPLRLGQHVVALIGAGMLQNGRGRLSNHWVVLTPTTATTSGATTPLRLFSWGQCAEQGRTNLTTRQLAQYIYGAWVYEPIP